MNDKKSSHLVAFSYVVAIHLAGCSSNLEFHGVPGKAPLSKDSDASPSRVLVEKSFMLGGVYDESLSVKPSQQIASRSFVLHKGAARVANFEQSDRPISVETKMQGRPAETVTQTFDSREAGLLDILIVMDNSGTMKAYQDQLATKLGPLLQNIGRTNWQIGVVTTDNGCLRDLITRQAYEQDQAAAQSRFSVAVSPGTKGSTIERGIEMGMIGMTGACSGTTKPWLRPGAVTAFLIVSDEENCGSGSSNCESRLPVPYHHYTPDEFIAAAPVGSRVYGLLQSNAVCGEDGYEVVPQNYYDLIARTHGSWSPICSTDYESILSDISADIGNITKSDYVLDHAPVAGSVSVTAGSSVFSTGFSVAGPKVTIPAGLLGDASSISISYQFAASDLWTSFTLSKKADPMTLSVDINGQEAPANTYALQSDFSSIVFALPPENQAKVTARFRANDARPNKFALEPKEPIADLAVSVDGVASTEAILDSTDNSVRFATPPMDGSKIKIRYRLAKDIQTTYEAEAPKAHSLRFISLVDEHTNAPIASEYADDKIKVPASEVEDLRQVRANFATSVMDSYLPHAPDPGTLAITAPAEVSECMKNAITAHSGKVVEFDCPGEVPEEVHFHYQYTDEMRANVDFGKWIDQGASSRMWVNDQEVFDFTLKNGSLVIPDNHLKKGNKITVRAMVLNRGKKDQ
jgi:hypothetical protein